MIPPYQQPGQPVPPYSPVLSCLISWAHYNIREIKRFFNSQTIVFQTLNQNGILEIDPIDLLAIQGICFFSTDSYKLIGNNKEILIGSYNKENDKFFLSLLKTITKEKQNELEKLLCFLFPSIRDYIQSQGNGTGTLWLSYLSEKNFGITKVFQKYFTLNPYGDGDEISVSMVEEFKSLLNLKAKLQDYIDLQNGSNTIYKWLMVIENDTKTGMLIPENPAVLIQVLCSYCYKIKETTAFFVKTPYQRIKEIVMTSMFRMNSIESFHLMQELLKNEEATSAIIPIIFECFDAKNEDLNRANKIIKDWDKEELLSICYEIFSNKPTVAALNPRFLYVLNRWKIEAHSSYVCFINVLIEIDLGIMILVKDTIRNTLGQTIGTPKPIKRKWADYRILSELEIPNDKIFARIEEIKDKNKSLYASYEDACSIYLSSFLKRDQPSYYHGDFF